MLRVGHPRSAQPLQNGQTDAGREIESRAHVEFGFAPAVAEACAGERHKLHAREHIPMCLQVEEGQCIGVTSIDQVGFPKFAIDRYHAASVRMARLVELIVTGHHSQRRSCADAYPPTTVQIPIERRTKAKIIQHHVELSGACERSVGNNGRRWPDGVAEITGPMPLGPPL